MEGLTECKISIKGNGPNFIRKKNNYNYKNDEEETKLYLLIESFDENKVKTAKEKLKLYLNHNSSEYSNSVKRFNLLQSQKELFNEAACEYCGQRGHKSWACPLNINDRTIEMKCKYCNDKGHPSIDCPNKPKEGLNVADLFKQNFEFNSKKVSDSILCKSINVNDSNKDINGDDKIIAVNSNTYEKMKALNAQKIKLMKKFKSPGVYNNFSNFNSQFSNSFIKEGNAVEYKKPIKNYYNFINNYDFNFKK